MIIPRQPRLFSNLLIRRFDENKLLHDKLSFEYFVDCSHGLLGIVILSKIGRLGSELSLDEDLSIRIMLNGTLFQRKN